LLKLWEPSEGFLFMELFKGKCFFIIFFILFSFNNSFPSSQSLGTRRSLPIIRQIIDIASLKSKK
jgi:hypothetical protein